jgi:hypothetical protein
VALVETSFLCVDGHERCQIHELLRQYAEELLPQDPARTRANFEHHESAQNAV